LVVTSMTPLVAQASAGHAVSAVAAASQWRHWLWVCAAGQVVFLPFVFVMAGRWSPRKARAEAEAHEQVVQRELAALRES
jgi:hypothetical protein